MPQANSLAAAELLAAGLLAAGLFVVPFKVVIHVDYHEILIEMVV